MTSGRISAAVFCALLLLSAALAAASHGAPAVCSKCDATIVGAERTFAKSSDANPEIQISKEGAGGKRTVVVTGPVLGSMDAPDIEADLSCDASGIVLTETIVRAAEYTGAAAKNVPWQPSTRISVLLKASSASLKVIWRIRLSNGKPLDPARVLPRERFPLVLLRTIR